MSSRLFVTGLCLGLGLAAGRPGAQPVVINEIHYAPAERTAPREFVELLNSGDVAVDLSGWFFSDGIDYTFGQGVVLGPREYIVVAQDPAALQSHFGDVPVVGPFDGRLSNDGEQLLLRNADGHREDEVSYGLGFPWPIVGGSAGLSIELIDTDLDNDLGGSWRASSPGLDDSGDLVRAGEVWRYRRGMSEASNPRGAWRHEDFDDGTWASGRMPVGYGESIVATELDDMRGGYTSVFLRKTFQIDSPDEVGSLTLEVVYDDGFSAWINGVHVARGNLSTDDPLHDATANSAIEDLDFNPFALSDPGDYLVAGTNVLAVQLHNASISGSSDCFLDARLVRSANTAAGPTPGVENSVRSVARPPALRQVRHSPEQPEQGVSVLVTVKATDAEGVDGVTLEYQIVEPGRYISLEDPEYLEGWTALEMNDDGAAGDALGGDDTWSVIVPGSVQRHRRLVRYRMTASDGVGHAVQVPYRDDPQPNFAYFVYNGPPGWTGRERPGRPWVEYGSDLLRSLPTYHLLTVRQDRLNALHVPHRWGSGDQEAPTSGSYGGSDYRWSGALVYDGEVYDHIRYRARGGVWRYSMGKNMWKFDFNRGHAFQARDDHGRNYRTRWDKLNFSAIIQQGNFRQRGEQGLFEGAGFRLHNLAGNAAPKTHFVHFRLIEADDEEGPDRYSGDFQGLYLAIEQMDGRFLDEHELPDGNLYKMEGGTGELNNQGPTQPPNRSDLDTFLNTYRNTSPPASWWRQNLDLPEYYSFRAISMAIHDHDMHAGKNYFYYHNPQTGLWSVLNWDLDLTWTTTYGGGGGRGPLNEHVLDRFSEFRLEYRNRVRELRDLLFNPEQTGILLDEVAGVVHTPGQASFVDADRAMWDRNPILVSSFINPGKAGHGRFYEYASSRDFAGMIRLLKSYVGSRGSWMDTNLASDQSIPRRPTVTSTSPAGFPVDVLTFRSSSFSDPQGTGTFGTMKWRVARVTPPGAPPFDPGNPKLYEVDAVWETEELTDFERDVRIPSGVLEIGARYRVRVRMRDDSGRSSRWSRPVEFTVGEPTGPFPQQDVLRVTEIMYHPPAGAALEFIEVTNIGAETVDLGLVAFTGGIEFSFQSGDVSDLAPGEYVVVVSDRIDFELYHDTREVLVAGEYSGRLSNGGEQVVLTVGANSTILDFSYDDGWYPLTDGGGHSLQIVDAYDDPATWSTPLNWTRSAVPGGSPGRGDGGGPLGGRQLPGDGNQDGVIDVSDPVSLLRRLFLAGRSPLPCDGEGLEDGGNLLVFDANGGGTVGVDDPVFLLAYLFQDGPPPAGGVRCVRVDGCPSACGL